MHKAAGFMAGYMAKEAVQEGMIPGLHSLQKHFDIGTQGDIDNAAISGAGLGALVGGGGSYLKSLLTKEEEGEEASPHIDAIKAALIGAVAGAPAGVALNSFKPGGRRAAPVFGSSGIGLDDKEASLQKVARNMAKEASIGGGALLGGGLGAAAGGLSGLAEEGLRNNSDVEKKQYIKALLRGMLSGGIKGSAMGAVAGGAVSAMRPQKEASLQKVARNIDGGQASFLKALFPTMNVYGEGDGVKPIAMKHNWNRETYDMNGANMHTGSNTEKAYK